MYSGKTGTNITHRGLVKFNISFIPAGSEIISANLTLWLQRAHSPEAQSVAIHRVTGSWGEGSSFATGGQCAVAAGGDATWAYRFWDQQLFWRAAGGDFVPGATTSCLVEGDGVSYVWTGQLGTQAPKSVCMVQVTSD